jgi:hypothetical protein
MSSFAKPTVLIVVFADCDSVAVEELRAALAASFGPLITHPPAEGWLLQLAFEDREVKGGELPPVRAAFQLQQVPSTLAAGELDTRLSRFEYSVRDRVLAHLPLWRLIDGQHGVYAPDGSQFLVGVTNSE